MNGEDDVWNLGKKNWNRTSSQTWKNKKRVTKRPEQIKILPVVNSNVFRILTMVFWFCGGQYGIYRTIGENPKRIC